jgi:uncharacterized LabA/DUF88 family protein
MRSPNFSRNRNIHSKDDRKNLLEEDTLNKVAPEKIVENSPIDPYFLKVPQCDRGRVAIFIDAENLFKAAQQLEISIDYHKLLSYLTQQSRLLRSFFYICSEPNNSKQQGFLLWMRHNNYRVVVKEFQCGAVKKNNVDVEIAVDMLSLVPHYDTAVLVGGNDELAYAVNALSYKGIRVEIVGLRNMTSDKLLSVADAYIDLGAIEERIEMK